ncbi:nucleotide exchange factor GrpE [Jatrophihabitans telluris]|uniref:Protein GrpE n=1 Tax=Jatrophihabitans telluris TaxID=2038343 RepID=A0ABY4QZN6_9ACTN|nr:nucleotide exchange factor GrpE [Jatrophihabitans telluris]UQX88321.1 nucleotide exchange factor GrpE [Jatrophihabitans telluris]
MTTPGKGDGTGAGGRPNVGSQPGFTFADKRKVNPDGTPKPEAATTDEQGPAAAEPVVELTDSGSGSFEEFEKALQEKDDLATERLADLQRLQAEYANYRKRVERDRDVARETTVAAVVESLLPVLDDIHLARQHGDLDSGPFVSIAEKLENALAKYGVERFGEPGAPFDPAVHDALMHVEEELAEGTEVTTVVSVLQPGYKIGDRVVRPARVAVADPS